MVILGGLEFVVGGFILHKYHKNKNEKKRLIDDAQQRRNNTFPGAKPPVYFEQQQPMMEQQKYACYTLDPQQQQIQPRPHTAQPHPQYQQQQQQQPIPQPYTIPRRPVPPQQPHWQQQIQPLQRADSMATLSRLPVANGSRYRNENPPLPPRPQLLHTQTVPQQQHLNHPYSHTGFSVSAPSFEPSSISPVIYPTHGLGRGNTVDDNWETYEPHVENGYYAPSVSTQLGEVDDPPPPYRP